MFKKTFSLFICCLLFFNLFGCDLNTNSINNTASKDQVTIRFSWWGGEDRHDKTVNALEKFEKAYPNIKVKVEFAEWDGFKKKMNMKIAGNDEPDLMQINYDWLETYSKDGTGFYDLKKVADSLDLDNFSKELLSYGTKNGVLNGIPISMNTKVMYYNKSLLDKYNINDLSTWDSLISAKSLINDDTYLLQLDEVNSWLFAMTYIKDKTGKDFLTSDNTLGFTVDDIKDLLTFYKSLLDSKVLQPINTVTSYDLSSDNCIGLSTWSSNADKISKGIAKTNSTANVTVFPSISGNNPITYVKPSMLYAISKNTEHPKEAALLMNYLLNNGDAAQILGLDRGIPSSKSAYETAKNNNLLTGLQFEAVNKTTDTQNVLINPYFENTLIKNIYNNALKEVTFDTSSIDDIANKTYSELNQTLEALK